MKRAEIEEQIKQILPKFKTVSSADEEEGIIQLTDLFIQLSEERCKEQRLICSHGYIDGSKAKYSKSTDKLILNAPFPTLD